MKNGMSRPVDDLGRIVLPIEIRRSMNINNGDRLNITVEGGRIVLQPAKKDGCVICGKAHRHGKTFKGKFVCASCALDISAYMT